MARSQFPVVLDGWLAGKARNAGSFERDDGTKVSYAETYRIDFESSDGTMQSVDIPVQVLDQVASFDVAKEPRFVAVHIVGDLVITDFGHRLVPTEVTRMATGQKAA